MPVFFNRTKRVLFIHTPKTGGTSIEFFFERNGFKTHYLDRGLGADSLNPVRRSSPQHMHAAVLDMLFDTTKFDFVFMTVRHPLGRLVSQYKMETDTARAIAPFEKWVLQSLAGVISDAAYKDNHLRPQNDFWLPGAAICKLEDGFGEHFVARLEDGIGMKFTERNVGRDMLSHGAAPDFAAVSAPVVDLVRAYYRQDFTRFGYKEAN
jgi:hypothetical protein